MGVMTLWPGLYWGDGFPKRNNDSPLLVASSYTDEPDTKVTPISNVEWRTTSTVSGWAYLNFLFNVSKLPAYTVGKIKFTLFAVEANNAQIKVMGPRPIGSLLPTLSADTSGTVISTGGSASIEGSYPVTFQQSYFAIMNGWNVSTYPTHLRITKIEWFDDPVASYKTLWEE